MMARGKTIIILLQAAVILILLYLIVDLSVERDDLTQEIGRLSTVRTEALRE